MTNSIPTRKLLLFATVSFGLGILFNLFVFGIQPGLGLTLFGSFVALSVMGFSFYNHKSIEKSLLFSCLALLFFSAQFVLRDSIFITIISILSSLLLLCLIVFIGTRKQLDELPFASFIQLFWMPFECLSKGLVSILDLFGRRSEASTDTRTKAIARGLLYSLPILFVFTLLFANADQTFLSWVKPLIDIDFLINESTVWRFILLLLISTLCLGAFVSLFHLPTKHIITSIKEHPLLKPTETVVILSSINALFFLFLLSQFTYFFGGDATRKSLDITYAEYAVSGFTELNIIALFSFVILHLAERAFASHRERYSKAFQGIYTLMIVQLFAIMSSSFYRLMVYEQAYGYTIKRLLSQGFILFLAICFSLLLYKVLSQKVTTQLGTTYVMLSVSFWMIVVAIHPELLATKLNINRFEKTGKIDITYLTSDLSADRITELEHIAPKLPSNDARAVQQAISKTKASLKTITTWKSWNLSRSKHQGN